MPRPRRPVKPAKVACSECAKQVPASVARTAEGQDYLMYFCGIDCQAKWQATRPQPKTR